MERERFIYAPVDVNIIDHPKALMAGCAAFGVFLAALCYCHKHELDGRIPIDAAKALLGGAGARWIEHLADPKIGWFILHGETAGGGPAEIEVYNYLKKNQSRAEKQKAKKLNRARQSKYRKSHGNIPTSAPRSVTHYETVTLPSCTGDGDLSDQDLREGESREGESAPAAETSAPTARQLEYQAAYERGIVAGKKSTFGLKLLARPDLHQAILTHAKDKAGKGYRGVILLEWIEFQAHAFAKWLATSEREEPKFWGSYQPSGWMRWLNDGRARPFPGGQPVPARPAEGNVVPANGNAETVEAPVDPAVMTRFLQSFGKGGGA
jgi:hypothetical protein